MTLVWMSGAAGRIGKVLRHGLRRPDRTLRLVDRAALGDPAAGEELVVGDVGDADLAAMTMADVDVAIHLAGIPDEAPFDDLLRHNIAATQRVLEAARQAGVARVVLASSHHVIGCHPRSEMLGLDAELRPDSYYGVSKAFAEHLGRLYHDKWGMEIVGLRIGSFRERPENIRQLSTWLSHRDGIHLFDRVLDAVDVGYLMLYGVSANTRSWWRNGAAAAAVGYRPRDDAELYAHQISDAEDPMDAPLLQGGVFAHPDYEGGRG